MRVAHQKYFIMLGFYEDVHTISPCVKRVLSKTGLFRTHWYQQYQYQSQPKHNISDTFKTNMFFANENYLISLGFLWSFIYDFYHSRGHWSKTGSFSTQCNELY